MQAVAGGAYELVLMDVAMPVMDGLEATRRIRAAETGRTDGRRTTIVALTARARPSDRTTCAAAGMDDYLAKPVTPAALSHCVLRWLPAAALGDTEAHEITPQAPAAAPGVFDRQAMLQRLVGNQKLAERVLRGFLAEAPSQIEALKESLAGGDMELAASQAHKMVGAAANVGGERLRALAAAIESQGEDRNLAAMRESAAWLDVEFGRFVDATASAVSDSLDR